MAWVAASYRNEIVDAGKEPLFLLLVGVVCAFLLIRVSVRLIRAEVRWWPGNVSAGQLHIHHVVFGTVAMVAAGVGGFASLGAPWHQMFALLFGVGVGLVLDEFALILRLEDVYWTEEGRTSVSVTMLAIVLIGLVLLGFTPFSASSANTAQERWSVAVLVALNGALVAVTLLKGKLGMGILGIFLFPLPVVTAIRLARPRSPWARWRYRRRPHKMARALRREETFTSVWTRRRQRVLDVLAGAPSTESRKD
jgi:hypothetical protein